MRASIIFLVTVNMLTLVDGAERRIVVHNEGFMYRQHPDGRPVEPESLLLLALENFWEMKTVRGCDYGCLIGMTYQLLPESDWFAVAELESFLVLEAISG